MPTATVTLTALGEFAFRVGAMGAAAALERGKAAELLDQHAILIIGVASLFVPFSALFSET